jgi:hypothetical protein
MLIAGLNLCKVPLLLVSGSLGVIYFLIDLMVFSYLRFLSGQFICRMHYCDSFMLSYILSPPPAPQELNPALKSAYGFTGRVPFYIVYTVLGEMYLSKKLVLLPNTDYAIAKSSVCRRYTVREDYAAGGEGEMLCSCDAATQSHMCKHKLKVLRIKHPDLRDIEIITALACAERCDDLGTRRGMQHSGMRYLLRRDPAPEVRSLNNL